MHSQSAADLYAWSAGGPGAVAIDLTLGVPAPADSVHWSSLPVVIVGLVPASLGAQGVDPAWRELVDVVVDPNDPEVDQVAATVATNPIAASTLALLLRGTQERSIGAGLVAESMAYSTLQGGPEFARWRASRPARSRSDSDESRVRCVRSEGVLEITLTRPEAANALDAPMRDALHDALLVAVLDAEVEQVDLRGEGGTYCGGGDLDEMGQRSDPATAHLIRLHRSLARLMAELADRTTVHLHGACAGSGIELSAFADQIRAAADTTISLPEVGLGLVPGAGGTVSLPARIGRHRTAWLALSGRAIDALTAQAWGLIDELET